MVKKYHPMECVSEKGVIRSASEPYIEAEKRKQKVFFTCEWVNRHANKPAMARGAQAMLSSGQVFIPKTSEGDDFKDELLRFDAAKDDNRVDAFVNLCLRLEFIWESAPPKIKPEKGSLIGGELKIKDLMPPRFKKKTSRWSFKPRDIHSH
jgi:hypothetical protein